MSFVEKSYWTTRAIFAKIVAQVKKMNLRYNLPAGYEIKELPTEEFDKLWLKPAKRIFNDNSLMFNAQDVYTQAQLKRFKKLRQQYDSKTHIKINLALYHRGKFVGWSWGYQDNPTEFYMCNSAVFEKHQGKGLYTCLMKEMLSRVIALGFSRIFSRHMLTNNSILIAKLKHGFKISSFEMSDRFGALVHLSFYPSKIQNDIMDFRTGHTRPNKRLKKIFQLDS
jgi:hypothetical protein